MSVAPALPGFGHKLNTPAYYDAVNGIIRVLKPASTLKVIANHLTAQGYQTPSGLEFNRTRLANYIHYNQIKGNNND